MWQDKKENMTKSLNRESAKKYCQNLNLDGFRDWYLPTKKELKSLIKDKSKLKNSSSDFYWSSTRENYSHYGILAVHVNCGYDDSYPEYSQYSVRCVRAR